jgi:hypothetical protein
LLVDSSYVPLILKLLQLQEIERIVNVKSEQDELKYVTRVTSSQLLTEVVSSTSVERILGTPPVRKTTNQIQKGNMTMTLILTMLLLRPFGFHEGTLNSNHHL